MDKQHWKQVWDQMDDEQRAKVAKAVGVGARRLEVICRSPETLNRAARVDLVSKELERLARRNGWAYDQ